MNNKTFYKTEYKSPLGNITICCNEQENIVGLWFENQKYFANNINGKITENNNLKIFIKTKNWLDKYFAGNKPNIKEIPIEFIGTKFQKSVWKILYKIPYGKVITYGDIAKQIAKKKGITKMSAQAIGGAVGHNPISVIVPCHRVIGKNGNLTGYAAGLDKKKKLLQIEKVDINQL
jgi:methylated-DNA-[protein]-cysteine S-methyltransferase